MKVRIPKHREFVIDIQEEDEAKKQECWDALQKILDDYKKQGKYRAVNGTGDIDGIFRNLCAEIDPLLK